MKILCLQLARFGDIYQSWPTFNALKRKYPDAEIHLLVRERFKAATIGLSSVSKVISLQTASVIGPILQGCTDDSLTSAKNHLSEFLKSLIQENYDEIINLSFSPASSYLTNILAEAGAKVAGYGRHADGYLAIPDDASSYFYAQVGVGRSNRIHLSDIFALVANVELTADDFRAPKVISTKALPAEFIAIHVGASSILKSCSSDNWRDIMRQLKSSYNGHIVLLGSREDIALLPQEALDARTINLIGQTDLSELFGILAKARGLLACDSMMIHMASLTNTPTLNISFPTVRFWETGPRATKSRIAFFENQNKLQADLVATEFAALLSDAPAAQHVYVREFIEGMLYERALPEPDDFAWQLIRALYMGADFPQIDSKTVVHAFLRLKELAHLGLEQLRYIEQNNNRDLAFNILNQIDALLEQVARFAPDVSPLVRWFQTEKLRIGPGNMAEVLKATQNVFVKLNDVASLYNLNNNLNDSLAREGLTWK